MALAEPIRMANIELPAAAPDILYRCIQCGIESREASCFAGIATKGPQQFAGTCITCNQSVRPIRPTQMILGVFALVFLPVIFLVAIRGDGDASFLELIIAASLLQPFLVIVHELGHVVTARIVGLEVALLTLGSGKKWGSGKLLNVPFRLYGWPLSGFTYLVTTATRHLRLRLWVTTLMGPVTNMILIAVAVMFWNRLDQVVDSNLLVLWILYNAILVVSSLLPRRSRDYGPQVPSDGMQLLQIPFKTAARVATAFGNTYAGVAFVLFNDADYAGARKVCLKGFQRLPDNPLLSVMLSACQINLGEYEAARLILEPLLNAAPTQDPEIRAAIYNNVALAIWLRDCNNALSQQSTLRADALSDRAYQMYPCVLPHRSTRALLLVATNHPNEALKLLEYSNYERGSSSDQGDQQIARAFALRLLDRLDEANQALAAGLQLNNKRRSWAVTLGLSPSSPPPASTTGAR